MDIASLTAQKIRAEYPHQSIVAFISCLLRKNQIAVDLWPIQTQKFSGCLWKNEDEWTIIINARQAPQRKLFTLAHELGHYFLHRHFQKQFTCNFSSKGPTTRLEQEANRFAAELLMPSEQVIYRVKKAGSAARAAHYFGVSEEAMQYRLDSLSIKST
jgi:Zn-dependent peptidase ImmA (M78 family)